MATFPSPNLWPSPLLFPGSTPTATVRWAPTLEDVADKAASLTVEGLEEELGDTDPDESGAYLVFSEETRPTARQVALSIAGAISEVAGFAGVMRLATDPLYAEDPAGLNRFEDLARETAAWLTVMKLEREKISEEADDAKGGYAAAEKRFNQCLATLEKRSRAVQPDLR